MRDTYHIYLTAVERRVVINSLIDLRNDLISRGKYTDIIDELIIKFTKAKVKKIKMRGGIFFAQGIYFGLGCKFQLFDPKKEQYIRPQTKCIIVADSVINTGSTIKPILEPDTLIASCVINEKAVPFFQDQLYTVRVSKNSFVGSNIKKQEGGKGPDTTMRLFNLI